MASNMRAALGVALLSAGVLAASLAGADKLDEGGDNVGAQRVLQTTVNNPAADATLKDTQASSTVAAVGNYVVVAWTDSGAEELDYSQFTGRAFSNNAGLSFTDLGALPATPDGDNGEPLLAADQRNGIIYLAAQNRLPGDAIQVFRSTDGGATFPQVANGTPGFGGVADTQEWPHLAVNGNLGAGSGRVHLCWTRVLQTEGTEIYASSSPNGSTFTVSPMISADGTGCNVAVGPDNAVYVFYYRGTGEYGIGGDNRLYMRKSVDLGVSFAAEVQVADLLTTSDYGDLNLKQRPNNYSFPQAAVSAWNGGIYVVYNDDPSASTVENGDIYLVRSSDGGTTWSAPVQVNDDDGERDQFLPALAFSPDGKRALLTYGSRVNDRTGNLLSHRRGRLASMKANGALQFNASFQLSADSRTAADPDPAISVPYSSRREGIAAVPGFFHTTWTDNLLPHNASPYGVQPDIRYARIDAVPTNADVSVQVNGPSAVDQGGTGSFEVVFTAAGGNATDVFVNVIVPTELVVRSALPDVGSCRRQGLLVGCYIGNLGAGLTRKVHLLLGGVEPGNRTLSASITTSSLDAVQGNNTAVLATAIGSVPASIATYQTGGINVGIPDNGTIDIPIDVPDEGSVLDINAYVRINHPRTDNLDLLLVSPSGRIVELSTDLAGGSNYGSGALTCNATFTNFNDSGGVSVLDGAAPFAGTFRPEQPLSDMVNEPLAGTWRLRITDDSSTNTGTAGCLKLRFVTAN